MYTNTSAVKLWTTVVDANVDLFHAQAAFSAEIFDLYTKWPRRSFGEVAAVVKSNAVVSAKVDAADETTKPVAKAAVAKRKAAKPAAKPVAKKAVAKKPAVAPTAKKPTKRAVAPKTATKAKSAIKKPATAPVAAKTAKADAKAPVDAAKPAEIKAASKPVSLPKEPDFTTKVNPVEPIADLNEPGKAVPQDKN